MISLLENYVQHLRHVERASRSSSVNGSLNYYMASDSVSPEEWAEFDNVYQIHCPQIYLDNIIRDVGILSLFDTLVGTLIPRSDNATILLLLTDA